MVKKRSPSHPVSSADGEQFLFKTGESKAEQIADYIESQIQTHKLNVGARLPSEREMAQHFNVNSATVGKAINMLVQHGLVKRVVGSGTYVEKIEPDRVSESIMRFCIRESCTFQEFTEARLALEPELAAMAAQRITHEQIEALEQTVKELEEAFVAEDFARYSELDMQFHDLIGQACGNSLLEALNDGLIGVSREKRRLATIRYGTSQAIRMSRRPRLDVKGMKQHQKIFEAIKTGDMLGARKMMRQHMLLGLQIASRMPLS